VLRLEWPGRNDKNLESPSTTILRLATRGSLLARTQSQLVATELQKLHPGLRVELVIMKTSGDQITERPLHEFGGKGLFTKELEQALLDEQVDFAVHSFKDVPTTMPLVEQSRLIIAAVPKREDPRDLLVSEKAKTVADLPHGAHVGTGSLRRRCQLLAQRPDLKIEPIRGNIDTRLRKQHEGQFDAVVLALAGVKRASLFDSQTMSPIDPTILLPAPAQGALALQCRRDDSLTLRFLQAMNDPATATCVAAERALVSHLQGDCLSPIAGLATVEKESITLRAAVGGRAGNPPVLQATASASTPADAAKATFEQLQAKGVMKLLHGAA
jgi:hydroxymethylbilane synthase